MKNFARSLLYLVALEALRRKKRYEQQLNQIDGTIHTIKAQNEHLKNVKSISEKMNSEKNYSKQNHSTQKKSESNNSHQKTPKRRFSEKYFSNIRSFFKSKF